MARLLRSQGGVVSRAQVRAAGASDCDIERLLRRRQWARAMDGVYVEHTGPLDWDARAWAAVLRATPSVLSGRAALRAHGLRGHQDGPVEVAIADSRRVRVGNAVHSRRDFATTTVWRCRTSARRGCGWRPPSCRSPAALARRTMPSLCSRTPCQERRTTAARLLAELDERERVARRRLLEAALADVAVGARSPPEARYLRHVERAHGLPVGRRQRLVTAGRASAVYRDVGPVGFRTLVELNGRLGHEWAGEVWDDLDRDLDSATTDLITLRAGSSGAALLSVGRHRRSGPRRPRLDG